jgi:hypothetical protein
VLLVTKLVKIWKKNKAILFFQSSSNYFLNLEKLPLGAFLFHGTISGIFMKRFQRTIENFTCENCGANVEGDGYTNHCPVCLWSKHVDINPGDRSSQCKGLMRPIEVIVKNHNYIIKHQCIKCAFEKINKSSPKDNFEALLIISSSSSKFLSS